MRFTKKTALVAAVLSVTIAGGGAAMATTSGSGDSSASTPAAANTVTAGSTPAAAGQAKGHGARGAGAGRRAGVIGKVVSDSTTGGAFNAGVLVVVEPDGHTDRFDLSDKSRAWRYAGSDAAPKREAAGSLPAGEVVTVRAVPVQESQSWARLIIDSGFAAR